VIADRKPVEIFERYEEITSVIDKESVIIKDNGIKTLARVASTAKEYSRVIMPYLFEHMRSCRIKSLPQYAESIFCAVKEEHQEEYLLILGKRKHALSPAQHKRVSRLINSVTPYTNGSNT